MGFNYLAEVLMLQDSHRELKATWHGFPKYKKVDHEKKIAKKSKPGRKSSQKLRDYEN